jgi:hypothetical protein
LYSAFFNSNVKAGTAKMPAVWLRSSSKYIFYKKTAGSIFTGMQDTAIAQKNTPAPLLPIAYTKARHSFCLVNAVPVSFINDFI